MRAGVVADLVPVLVQVLELVQRHIACCVPPEYSVAVVGEMATVMRVGLTANAGMAHKANANKQFLRNGNSAHDAIVFYHAAFNASLFALDAVIDNRSARYADWGFSKRGPLQNGVTILRICLRF